MSQRPSASRPASRSPSEGQRIVLPPVQFRDDLRQEGRQQPEFESRGFPPHGQSYQNTASGEDWRSSRQPRDLGVHSILNPSEPEGSRNTSRRVSGGTNESPTSAIGPAPVFGASPSSALAHTFPGQQQLISGMPLAGDPHSTTFSRAPRRILTPRSPSARIASAGRGMGPAPGTIDAHQTPFLSSRGRSYVTEPGPQTSSEVPPMLTPPVQQQQHHHHHQQQQQQQQYGFPPRASTPSNAPRRPSEGTMQAPGRTPQLQSASPSISVSSHNPTSSQTSPASFLFHKGAQSPQFSTSYYPGSSFGTAIQAGGGMQYPGPSGIPEGPYSDPAPLQGSALQSSSSSSSRQTSASDPIQVLTITTSEGSFSVPVDTHQASKLADEKRARNAGASARFRQRRKEKEKEANTSIEKLQQQTRDMERKMRDVERDRDRYRQERDRLRDLVYRNPDMRHLAVQGPPSPQSMRSGAFQGMGMGIEQGQGGGPPPLPVQMGYHAPDNIAERAPRRRRTESQNDFTPHTYSLPPASTLPPVQATSYAPGPTSQDPPNLPPLRIENPSGPQNPNPNITPSPSAGPPPPPFDPYSRGQYERGWGDPGRR